METDTKPSNTTSQKETLGNQRTPEAQKGFRESIRSATPQIILDNAPRIVGLLKFTGAFCMTRGKQGFFAMCGYGFMLANAMLMVFGGKKTAEQKAKLEEQNEAIKKKGPVLGHIAKVLQPQNYPYESAATVYTASSLLWVSGGLMDKDRSIGRLIGGLASLGSDANAAFTKEKIGESYKNPHEKGTLKYHFTELKNRPVLVSSSLNIISDIAEIAAGIQHKKKHGKFNNDFYAGTFLMLGNLFQGIFVNKNEYSLEKTGDEIAKESKEAPSTLTVSHKAEEVETGADKPKKIWTDSLQEAPSKSLGMAA